jgi:hypothetical protein
MRCIMENEKCFMVPMYEDIEAAVSATMRRIRERRINEYFKRDVWQSWSNTEATLDVMRERSKQSWRPLVSLT